MVEGEPELEHAQQKQRQNRDDDRELDETLAPPASPETMAPPASHRIGSIRKTFRSVKDSPPGDDDVWPNIDMRAPIGVCHW